MGYSPPFERLQTMTDDDLRREYDGAAENTVVGTAFYLDELRRRALDRASMAALAEARAARRLAVANMIVAVVAVVVAIAVPLLARAPEVQPCTVLVGTETCPAQCLTSP